MHSVQSLTVICAKMGAHYLSGVSPNNGAEKRLFVNLGKRVRGRNIDSSSRSHKFFYIHPFFRSPTLPISRINASLYAPLHAQSQKNIKQQYSYFLKVYLGNILECIYLPCLPWQIYVLVCTCSLYTASPLPASGDSSPFDFSSLSPPKKSLLVAIQAEKRKEEEKDR